MEAPSLGARGYTWPGQPGSPAALHRGSSVLHLGCDVWFHLSKYSSAEKILKTTACDAASQAAAPCLVLVNHKPPGPPPVSLALCLACGLQSSDSPCSQLSAQHHPALYGELSTSGSMSVNSFIQPMAVECLPCARSCFRCWGLRVSKAQRSLSSGFPDLSSGRSPEGRTLLWVSCPQPLA